MIRFTLDGSKALEAHLAQTCEKVLAGVKSLVPAAQLEGIALGGGYGRGEGGVLKTPGGDQPYNDLEFFVFIRGNAILAERKFRHPLHELGESLSPDADLEVEFKVLTLDKLRRSPPNMFYYDLVAGHRWILGDDSLFAGCEQHQDAAKIPLHEATRLLFNRCSGLLYSLERLQRKDFGEAEADFVGRNLAKAKLAFGDVLLAAHGLYHWSCRERHARLAKFEFQDELVWAAQLVAHHAAGVEFKLHPQRSTESREALAARHVELSELGQKLWLWIESKRLGVVFKSSRDYAMSVASKCPETSSLRNRLVNFRAFGAGGLACHSYPRQRLFHALALLLWDEYDLGKLRSELRTDAPGSAGLISAYEQLWRRFN
ncbi:MAG: hypothetical protein WCK57_02865 [Verrucomicrobiae bacterium]